MNDDIVIVSQPKSVSNNKFYITQNQQSYKCANVVVDDNASCCRFNCALWIALWCCRKIATFNKCKKNSMRKRVKERMKEN